MLIMGKNNRISQGSVGCGTMGGIHAKPGSATPGGRLIGASDPKTEIIPACLIIDDFPLNAAYWRRAQQAAMGFQVVAYPDCGWSRDWPRQRAAPFISVDHTRQFADLAEEFGVRGKFTVLPCPGGLGRVDQSVCGLEDAALSGLLDIVRQRIVPSFEISPEILTHTMALVPATGALLPHAESAWVSHLAARSDLAELTAYLRHGWSILSDVGIHPTGLTVGGMNDPSGIGKDGLLTEGHHRDAMGQALFAVMREFGQSNRQAFIFTGAPARDLNCASSLAPEKCYDSAAGERLYELLCFPLDMLLGLYYGEGDVQQETEPFISADLSQGSLVEHVESGKALVFHTHCSTLSSLNTGLGLQMLREILMRLRNRYGKRVQWMTPTELIAWGASGETNRA
jgi:hypothetical protein